VIAKLDNKVLMEKRPPAGIWGGLWCFLEVNEQSKILPLLAKNNLTIKNTTSLESFRHTFSHFHLDITPIIVDCQQQLSEEVNDVKQQKWYDLTTEASVGLAASTNKLIEQVKQIQLY